MSLAFIIEYSKYALIKISNYLYKMTWEVTCLNYPTVSYLYNIDHMGAWIVYIYIYIFFLTNGLYILIHRRIMFIVDVILVNIT